jgi:hypothetical protein
MRRWRIANPGANAAIKAAHHARRMLMLRIIKQEMGCIDCGYNINAAALEFDHVRGVKLFNLSTGGAWRSIKAVQAELEKCVVRCSNCHHIRSAQGV